MKNLKLIVLFMLTASMSVLAQNKEFDPQKSEVKWTGNKIGGSHYGTIKIKSGFVEFKNGQITAGKIIMDMNSIVNLDLKDAGYNQKLVGHLKSDDFFGVDKYPTATFEIVKATKINKDKASVSGKITIKGKTEIVNFEIVKKGNVYSTQLKLDRSKFDVRYGSNSFFDNLGDKAIDDIFILDIKLVFK